MLSFAADENFNIHIVNGVLRRLPNADIVRVQDAGLEGADDPSVCWSGQLKKGVFWSLAMSTPSRFRVRTNRAGLADAGRV